MDYNTSQLPYFIKPSLNLLETEKIEAYTTILSNLQAILSEEVDTIVKMVTINTILKMNLPYAYWVGFYRVVDGKLKVGPYQGTLGCIDIELGRGVCGEVAVSKKTKIVSDVHQLEQGKHHIACDPNSNSEIVLPVFNSDKKLIAVLDIDSTLKNSFDSIDKKYLEKLIAQHF